jgi:two-component system alkaline phosphatase synthesis response regulator PhoP
MSHRVLICDDEPHILHAVSFKLSAGGMDVVRFNNGREAIEWVESNTPDFVITDYQMPEVDGFEFCRYLRSRPETADVPIVMLTAKAMELSEELVKEQWKLEAVLMKPFSPRGLLELVKKTLSQRGTTAAMTC